MPFFFSRVKVDAMSATPRPDNDPNTQPQLTQATDRLRAATPRSTRRVAGLRFSETFGAGSFTQILKAKTSKLLIDRPLGG